MEKLLLINQYFKGEESKVCDLDGLGYPFKRENSKVLLYIKERPCELRGTMKICFVSLNPKFFGGGLVSTRTLANALKNMGYEISFAEHPKEIGLSLIHISEPTRPY